MADVFLSYKRSDSDAVGEISRQLRSLGLSVWFDASLSAGSTFSEEIDREARAAKTVLVCWSPTARASRWVIAEAMIGFEADKLTACYVEGPSHFNAPTPFNTIHAPDLRDWLVRPNADDDGWRSVLASVGRLCQRDDLRQWGELPSDASAHQLERWVTKHHESPLFMVAHTLLAARKTYEAEIEKQEEALRTEYALKHIEQRRQAEEELRLADEEQRLAEEKRKREQGPVPTFFGSILAIPIFLVVYVLVSVVAYIGIILFQMLNLDPRGGGLTYGAELFASAFSAYFGVRGGRGAIDALLKAWTGWPTFIVFVSCWAAFFYVPLVIMHYQPVWWPLALAALQCVVSVGTTFFAIAKKADLD